MAYFSSLEGGFEMIFDSHMQNEIAKLKMINWYRFDTNCKNEKSYFPTGLASQVLLP